ncbi:MAG TPA: DUF2304 domain-containing protein [Patescibacteria group bacterium]|nr:DUF2304 domain-containing protein [Patescibacteria group bacterium]
MLFKGLLIAFALFAFWRAWTQFHLHQTARGWFILWTAVWAGVIAAAAFPSWTDAVAAASGVERGADLAAYASIVILFYAVFRLFVRVEQADRNLTRLVRSLALERGEREEEKKAEIFTDRKKPTL